MSVTLRERKNGDGSISFVLDIYHDGKRSYEFLKHLKLVKAANLTDRKNNKDKREQARAIAIKKAQELSANDYSMITDVGKKTIIADWMQSYVDSYQKKDKRNMQGALNRFKHFLIENKKAGLTFGRLDVLTVADFQDYLRIHSEGEGAKSYFSRFKKMMKRAHQSNLILRNPATDVQTKKSSPKRKDVLTLEEVKSLMLTSTESLEVKRAFIFCCQVGLRWCDTKPLKWESIDLKNKQIKIGQTKVDGASKEFVAHLNDTAIQQLGKAGKSTELVFNLPTANGANKTLKAWVKRAGIKKKISWHNARHSVGTNLRLLGEDLTVIAKVLGHSSIKHTGIYTKMADDITRTVTDRITIKFD